MERRTEMGKSKSTKEMAAKTRKPAKAVAAAKEKKTAKAGKPAVKKAEKTSQREDLCVFAFRLTPEERDAIHKAAGPGKASKFVRALTVAAARNDAAAVKAIMEGLQMAVRR
jgi:hypothetical protein